MTTYFPNQWGIKPWNHNGHKKDRGPIYLTQDEKKQIGIGDTTGSYTVIWLHDTQPGHWGVADNSGYIVMKGFKTREDAKEFLKRTKSEY